MKYKINKKDIFKNLSFSYFLIAVGIIYQIISFYFIDSMDMLVAYLFIAILLGVVCFLFIDYLLNSYKGEIAIDSDRIILNEEDNMVVINKEDVIKVILFAAPSVKRKSTFRLLPFEAFYYVTIKCKNHDDIIITTLSDYNLYENIRKEEVFKNKIYISKKGFSGNGSLINSIIWTKT